ncbi:hypothetical protein WN48_05939 [Eufriesea mexicana]|nr:hypothetical protein WN48_05939 [Eufriesea mexicana]
MFIPDTLRSCMVEPDVSTYLQAPSVGQVPPNIRLIAFVNSASALSRGRRKLLGLVGACSFRLGCFRAVLRAVFTLSFAQVQRAIAFTLRDYGFFGAILGDSAAVSFRNGWMQLFRSDRNKGIKRLTNPRESREPKGPKNSIETREQKDAESQKTMVFKRPKNLRIERGLKDSKIQEHQGNKKTVIQGSQGFQKTQKSTRSKGNQETQKSKGTKGPWSQKTPKPRESEESQDTKDLKDPRNPREAKRTKRPKNPKEPRVMVPKVPETKRLGGIAGHKRPQRPQKPKRTKPTDSPKWSQKVPKGPKNLTDLRKNADTRQTRNTDLDIRNPWGRTE